MYTAVIIIIIIASILLGLVVLMQNSKGGGLASEFSSSNQIMGVRKTADFLEKATWTLAIVIVVLSFISGFLAKSVVSTKEMEGVKSKAQSAQTTSVPMQPTAPTANAPVEQTTPAEPGM
ncbi:MAG: preprotein translocase subunit SecG [Bacteroidales bacterium]|jgi:preprotein translocase subunit SecG|nr:preprotein translocase subunit SecG [Bacteroidales bacterium]MDD2686933.1 preprotein translocase subunit SecG [Bacteroidales bacterium]MDD3330100.1 preprotein translocase subunit SecG [Bacteroidales bacterium]MDD3690889.1 preprotein translocase subunit SecG [Bacteroidales bacterium]MDD4044689.1 preprotein translocase subunit SecG [Bacteroidales bacterium]